MVMYLEDCLFKISSSDVIFIITYLKSCNEYRSHILDLNWVNMARGFCGKVGTVFLVIINIIFFVSTKTKAEWKQKQMNKTKQQRIILAIVETHVNQNQFELC